MNNTEDLLLPKAIVFCRLNAEENFERIKKRKPLMSYHRGLTDEELYENIKKAITENELRFEKFKSLNIPVLEVSLSKIDRGLGAEVNKFIIAPAGTQ